MILRTITGILLLLVSTLTHAQESDTLKYKLLIPEEFIRMYSSDDNALLIDVREFFEYKKSRIKDAVNVPSSGNLEFASDTLGKENALYLYCTSGFRSKRAASFFGKHGFDEVYSLDGGITRWKKEGMHVEKKRLRKRG